MKNICLQRARPGRGGERAQEVCPSTHVTDCVCYYGRDEVRGWCSKKSKPRAHTIRAAEQTPSEPQAPFADSLSGRCQRLGLSGNGKWVGELVLRAARLRVLPGSSNTRGGCHGRPPNSLSWRYPISFFFWLRKYR